MDSTRARVRLVVEADGSLRLSSGSDSELLAAPGVVCAASLVEDDAAGAALGLPDDAVPCVLLRLTDAAPVAIPLAAWSGDRLAVLDSGGADHDLLELVGVRSLLAALGRDDAWTFDAEPVPASLECSPRVLDAAEPTQRLARVVLIGRVSGIAFVIPWVVHGIVTDSRRELPWWPVLLLALIAAGLLLATYLLRPRRSAAPAGAVDLVVLDDGSAIGRDDAGDLVLVDPGGGTAWMPGPSAGGVLTVTALVSDRPAPLGLVLASAEGAVLGEVAGSALTAGTVERVRRMLADAGVVWHDKRSPRGSPVIRPAAVHLGAGLPQAQTGEACFVSGALGVGALIGGLSIGHLASAVLGGVTAAGAVVLARVSR